MPEYKWEEIPNEDDGGPNTPAQKPRFYTDRGIPDPMVTSLRAKGLKVIRSIEELPEHAPDDQIRMAARRKGMILLTKDMDFWDDREHPLNATSGIVIINTDERQLEAVFWFYYDFINHFTKADWVNAKALFNQEVWRFKRKEWTEEKMFKTENGRVYQYVRVQQSSNGR